MDGGKTELVKLAKHGNQAAFEALFLGEKEYLYKMAFLYTKNKEDAMDLVQECILRCIQSIGSLKNPEVFRTWMTRILINCAKAEWKKRKYYTDMEEVEVFAAKKEGVSEEEKMDLYHAIDCLKFPYKTIIIQRYFAEAKMEEIAQLLGMPLNTVKVYHSRAKEQLRFILKEELV